MTETSSVRAGSSAKLLWESAGGSERRSLPNLGRGRIGFDPEDVERGLAQLVLTLVDLLRQLMERQAIKRMDGGSLTAVEIERLGLAFLRLSERMEDLKQTFGFDDEDLNLHLGPLGDLI